MHDEATGGPVVRALETLTPAAEVRVARRLNLLLGVVPLPEMSQEEANWLFQQKVRLAGEQGDQRDDCSASAYERLPRTS